MVDVKKDNRKWTVKLTHKNTECPHLYYPANYHGCRASRSSDDDECVKENCLYIERSREVPK